MTQPLRQQLITVMGILGRLVLILALLVLVIQDVTAYRWKQRGVESGLAPDLPVLESPRTGINVSLERYTTNVEMLEALSSATSLGYGAVVQHFWWDVLEPEPGQYDWAFWDQALPLVREQGLQIIAVLERSPSWARPVHEEDNPWAPPLEAGAFARFAAAFAERYGDQIRAYQIWDRPNIYPHWGQGAIDPAGYVSLLQEAATAIRTVDPDALIIGGGMAPNTERSGRNMSDVLFLKEVYRLGGAPYFDVLGVKAYGFWSGAYDRRVDADVLNLSRIILLRDEMRRHDDHATPVWALEGGWAALPEGWQGEPSPLGSDSPTLQASRLKAAFARMQREWPWMTLFCAQHLQPAVPESDPLWGLSLLDAAGAPRPLMLALEPGLQASGAYAPGHHAVRAPLLPQGLPYHEERAVAIGFYGSDLAVDLDASGLEGELRVLEPYRRVTTLNPETGGVRSYRIVSGLPVEERTITLVGTAAQIGAIQGLRVGARPNAQQVLGKVLTALLLAIWLAAGALEGLRTMDWRRPYRRARGWADRCDERALLAGLALLFALAMAAPGSMIRLGLLAVYGLGVLLRPDAALLVAVAAIPLAPVTVSLGPGRFAITELAVICAVLARGGAAILSGARLEPARRPAVRWVDVLLLAFVVWAAVGAWRAEYQREALRELRTAVAEPALLYLLLRLTGGDARFWRRAVDALFASAAGVALYALARYPFSGGVIEAEGVRRARAFYGSPNNLALYLERLLPLGLSVASEPRTPDGGPRRKWVWAAGTVAVLIAIVLTYSRGAWLLGVPAGLLVVGLLKGRRLRRITLVALGLLMLGMIPLMQTERFSSLLNLQGGTTFLRLSLWQSSWQMIRDHPWTGVGLDNFLYYYGDYILPGAEIERWLSHPHNIVLDLWVRTGLPGLMLFLGAVIAAVTPALRRWRTLLAGSRTILAGLLGGLAAMLAHGTIDNAVFVPELAHWIAFVLAALVTGKWTDSGTCPSPEKRDIPE